VSRIHSRITAKVGAAMRSRHGTGRYGDVDAAAGRDGSAVVISATSAVLMPWPIYVGRSAKRPAVVALCWWSSGSARRYEIVAL